MTDVEYRALIEYHASCLTSIREEPARGYGLIKKQSILDHIERMKQLAENLE